VLVREAEDGTLRVFARSATGQAHELAWEPVAVGKPGRFVMVCPEVVGVPVPTVLRRNAPLCELA